MKKLLFLGLFGSHRIHSDEMPEVAVCPDSVARRVGKCTRHKLPLPERRGFANLAALFIRLERRERVSHYDCPAMAE